jgi:hypothetical protein
LVIDKPHGKLSVGEIEKFLREKNMFGYYLIFLNATESSCEGSGWGDEVEQRGDSVALYEYISQETCPACGGMTPPEYCPNCDIKLSTEEGEQ